jgi:general secretion pathway protein M
MALPNFVERVSRLNARERRLAGMLAGVFGFLLFVGLPVGLEYAVHARRGEVDDLRGALDAVQAARGSVRERQAKKDAIAARYAKKAPPLAGFLADLAKAQKLEITDSVDRPDVPHGKRYTERATIIHLKKSGLGPISKFLESIEKSGYPVIVSRLDLRKRSGEPDSYDVEIGVSAYDRAEKAPPSESPGAAPAASEGATP